MIAFYILAPIPLILARNCDNDGSGGGLELARKLRQGIHGPNPVGRSIPLKYVSVFLSVGMIVSAFALPCVLANRDVIEVNYDLAMNSRLNIF